jgi:eukaryotic-like serine/threonine-protein kinase
VEQASTQNSRTTVDALSGTLVSDPETTIHTSRPAGLSADSTLSSTRPSGPASRGLPRISVVLGGSLSDRIGLPVVDESSDDRDIEVLSTLGEGGMGRVFLARQHSLDREVAIKTVRDTASETERAALLSEGAITGHLEHPGIVPVHALGVDGEGRPVLVMKRVEGVEWAALLHDPKHPVWEGRAGKGADRLDDHLEILLQVCDAVHFAHSRGIVHRDIKPQNVFIGRYREVYLGDWGLAVRADREPRSAALCGTPAFMAPEMARGDRVDSRTDIYLLGATLHRILTGKSRHGGDNVRAAVSSALDSTPVDYPTSVPDELAVIANRATSRDPADRHANVAEMRHAIADYLRHKGSIALGQSARERLAKLRELSSDAAALRDPSRQDEIDLVLAEARFALREALNIWSENPVARQVAIDLEEVLAARRTRAADLERLADELDPTVARRQRTISTAALAAIGVGLSVASFAFDRGTVTPLEIFRESFGPLALAIVMVTALRKQLLRTLVNRRVVAATFTAIGGVTVNRALGLLAGMSTSHILMHDSLLIAAIAFASAALLFRWLAWLGAVMLSGAIVAAVAPAHAMHAFSLASGVGLVVSVWFVWQTKR